MKVALPALPRQLVFVAAYLVLSGFVVLLTKGIVLVPIVRWLRARTDPEIDLLLRLGGKGLIAAGLAVIAVWGWRHRRARSST